LFLDNGTAINLAKVPGSPEYSALIERLIKTQQPELESRYDFLGRWQTRWRWLKRIVGLPATKNVAVLAKLIADLKTATEAVLQTTIHSVSITAVWLPVWEYQEYFDNDINDALVYGGLAPWADSKWEEVYLAEVYTALAGNGRKLCHTYHCDDDDDDGWGMSNNIFFIRYVKRCYFFLCLARCSRST
jgi:hypothetical protein